MENLFNGATLDNEALHSFTFTNIADPEDEKEELFNTGLSSLGDARAYDYTKEDGKQVLDVERGANGQGLVTAMTGFAAKRIATIPLFRTNQWIALGFHEEDGEEEGEKVLKGDSVTIKASSKEEEAYYMNMAMDLEGSKFIKVEMA